VLHSTLCFRRLELSGAARGNLIYTLPTMHLFIFGAVEDVLLRHPRQRRWDPTQLVHNRGVSGATLFIVLRGRQPRQPRQPPLPWLHTASSFCFLFLSHESKRIKLRGEYLFTWRLINGNRCLNQFPKAAFVSPVSYYPKIPKIWIFIIYGM